MISEIGELVSDLADLLSSWRLYLGVGVSVLLAIWLHNRFGEATWVWFVSVPLVIFGVGGGLSGSCVMTGKLGENDLRLTTGRWWTVDHGSFWAA